MPLLIIPLAFVVAVVWFIFRKRPGATPQDAILEPHALDRAATKALPSTALSRR